MKYEVKDGVGQGLITYVINLKRRPERLTSFWQNWKGADGNSVFGQPHVWYGYDGIEHAQEMPVSFLSQETCNRPAAWGCVMTHAAIAASDNPTRSDVAVFEDDAHFVPHFPEKAQTYITSLPDDFDFAYLGGFHAAAPRQIGISLAVPTKIHGTHGYLVRRRFIRRLAEALSKCDNHPDLIIEKLLRESKAKTFCPVPALVGQGGFVSDIVGKFQPKEF